MCLSADVGVALDPNYKSVSEEKNSAYMGGGLTMCKYTGARGKYSTSDANAEFVCKVRRIFAMYYIDGWSWQKIAYAIGTHCEATPRNLHNRYLARRFREFK